MTVGANGTPYLIKQPYHLRTTEIIISAAEWQIGFPTGNWVATYRGIRIVDRPLD
jgi:hypothetical protein